jgi:hypothetical protein
MNGVIGRVMERQSRTIRTRSYVLSMEEVESFRILGVYNSTALLSDEISGVVGPPNFEIKEGNSILGESSVKLSDNGEPMQVHSAIVFADRSSMMAFALSRSDWFVGSVIYQELYN